MAEIQFERRGRPLWLVALILVVVLGLAYYAWVSCAALQRQHTLAPTAAPAVAPSAAPATPPASAPAVPPR